MQLIALKFLAALAGNGNLTQPLPCLPTSISTRGVSAPRHGLRSKIFERSCCRFQLGPAEVP